jgi:methionyl-tRNA synthetase
VHKVLRYDDSGVKVRWQPTTLPAGQALRKPHALYKKLDTSIVDEERARLEARLGIES